MTKVNLTGTDINISMNLTRPDVRTRTNSGLHHQFTTKNNGNKRAIFTHGLITKQGTPEKSQSMNQ